MSSPQAKSSSPFKFWGHIATEEEALGLIKGASITAYICAGITGLFAGAAILGFPLFPGITAWSLIDSSIFAGLGWWTSRRSRVGAVLALLFYIVERVVSFETMSSGSAVMTVFFIIFFANGVRGAMAYWRLKGKEQAGSTADRPPL